MGEPVRIDITKSSDDSKKKPATGADFNWQRQASLDAWSPGAKGSLSKSDESIKEGTALKADTGLPTTTPDKPSTNDWTMAYFLGSKVTYIGPNASVDGSKNESERGWLSAQKLKELERVAAETRGKPVTALVDVVRENDTLLEKERKAGETNSRPEIAEPTRKPEDYLVDRYRIKDGKVELIGTRQSQGLSNDIASLIQSTKDEPSRKLGMVINVDGGGNRGLLGAADKQQPIGVVEEAMEKALKSIGRPKMDMLDFDACIMSQTGVLDKFSNIANNIVASAETESDNIDESNGQNLAAGLNDLILNPSMNGKQFGNALVADAAAGKNDDQYGKADGFPFGTIGTLSLTNVDATRIGELSTAVNNLGKTLKVAVSDPANKQAVDDCIKSISPMARFGEYNPELLYGEEKRDLKQFSEKLRKFLKDGKLTDKDGTIAKALDAVDIAKEEAVTSYYGNKQYGYDKQGGISIFLPSVDFRDTDTVLKDKTQFARINHEITSTLSSMSHGATDNRGLAPDVHGAISRINDILATTSEDSKSTASSLSIALSSWEAAKTDEDRIAIGRKVQDESKKLLLTQQQNEQIKSLDCKPIAEKQQGKLNRELGGELVEWKAFVKSMGWSSCEG